MAQAPLQHLRVDGIYVTEKAALFAFVVRFAIFVALGRFEHSRAQSRRERERDDERNHDRKRHREAERVHESPDDARHKRNR